MLLAEASETSLLAKFFDLVYGDEEGLAYVATLTSVAAGDWEQYFFKWPYEREEMEAFILEARITKEVYSAPALFNERRSSKETVKSASVVWCEFDGTVPDDIGEFPEPSIRIQSSFSGHQHWYWKLDRPIPADDLERINRALAYGLGADTSGWDAPQVLRPPDTYNHKRKRHVQALTFGNRTFSPGDFAGLPEPPPTNELPVPDSIPEVVGVIAKYPFKERILKLFREGPKDDDRSNGLMSLGYDLAEMQMTNDEVFAVLLNADQRWGKFQGRPDQYRRLMEIVTIARAKYPLTDQATAEETRLIFVGVQSLIATEAKLEWVVEGLLQKQGYFLLTGPSGVGKTQLALQAAACLAVGKPFLDYPVGDPQKVGFLSLEMGLVDLKYFLSFQLSGFSRKEITLLENNFKLLPLGEPLYLTDASQKKRVEEVVERENFRGLFYDSLGSVTDKTVSDEETVKNLMDWNDHLRNQAGVFTWFIHHHRKASGQNKKPNALADVYGNQYITARTTTTAALWPTVTPNTVQVIPLKVRLTTTPVPYNIVRSSRLLYSRSSGGSIAAPLDAVEELGIEDTSTGSGIGAF